MTDRDPSLGPDGLTRRDRDLIRSVLARYPAVRRVTLFGSRAMGTFGRGSDIDLALEGAGLDARTLTHIAAELEDSDLPYKVDLLLRNDQLEPKLEAHIRREGKPFGWRQFTGDEGISLEYGKSILGDLVEFQRGFDLPATDREAGAFPVIAATGAVGTHHTYKVKGPGVVIGRSGSIGGAQFIESDFWPLNTTLWAKDFRGNDPLFVFYFVKNIDFSGLNAGSSVPTLNRNHIHQVAVRFPLNVDEQRAIAGVLGALDDKIEQNRRTARALERLARAIFRAWFVDFEPVKAKAAGATSFPGMAQPVFDALSARFVDSEVGPVPERWTLSTIGELAKRVAMGPFGSDIKTSNFVTEGVPVIRGGNLTDGFVDEGFVYLTEAKADQLSNANAFPGDIVITHRGTLGQIGLIPAKSRHRRYVVSQSQMLIRPSPDVLPSHFLYFFLTSPDGQHELLANRSQTGVPAISRPTTSVKAIRLVAPDKPFLRHFESIVSMVFDCRVAIEAESRKLAQMRDYLLPKLLSGEVRVSVARTGTEGGD